MNIHPIHAIQAAYRRAAGQNPMADTQDILDAVAAEFGLPPDAVADAIEMPAQDGGEHLTFSQALAQAMGRPEAREMAP